MDFDIDLHKLFDLDLYIYIFHLLVSDLQDKILYIYFFANPYDIH